MRIICWQCVSTYWRQKKEEGKGGVGIGGNGSAGDVLLAEEEQDKVKEDEYTQLCCESPHRAAKTVALARIHVGNKDEMIEEEQDREEEDKDTMSKGES
jgi:hypothetical protein